jgi:hypothetical protein
VLWLLISLLWSLVLVVPLCLLLRSLGIFRHDTTATYRSSFHPLLQGHICVDSTVWCRLYVVLCIVLLGNAFRCSDVECFAMQLLGTVD